MAEITEGQRQIVIDFLRNTFALPPKLAVEYAEIAILLSDDTRMLECLSRISAAVGVVHQQLAERLQGDARHGLRGRENLLGKSILLLCKALGWTVSNNYQLQGNVDAQAFKTLVRGGHMWRDHISANHGDYSHCLQWLAVYCVMPDRALALYKASVEYTAAHRKFYRYVCGSPVSTSDVSLWVFLVDCFPATHDGDDWREWIKSTTSRSPSKLRQLVMNRGGEQASWLCQAMNDHQEQLGWRAGRRVNPIGGAQARQRGFENVEQLEAAERIKRGAILQKVDPSLQFRLEHFFNLEPEAV